MRVWTSPTDRDIAAPDAALTYVIADGSSPQTGVMSLERDLGERVAPSLAHTNP
jgi:hypothetical protein